MFCKIGSRLVLHAGKSSYHVGFCLEIRQPDSFAARARRDISDKTDGLPQRARPFRSLDLLRLQHIKLKSALLAAHGQLPKPAPSDAGRQRGETLDEGRGGEHRRQRDHRRMASLSSLAFHNRVESMRLWGLLSEVDPMLRTTGLVAAMRAGTAFAHFLLGRYDEAASWAAMASQDNPDYNGRTARAGTQGNGSAAATQSRATCFHSQRRGGPLAR